jgi:hypothetical protein
LYERNASFFVEHGANVLDRFQYWPSRWSRAERCRAQQRRHERQAAVLGTQLFEIQIVVRAREVVDLCDGVGKFIPCHQTEDGPTNPGIRCSFVQQHGAGLLQLLGCSIEVTDRPEPILLPDGFRSANVGDDEIEIAVAADQGGKRLPRYRLRRREDDGLDPHHVFPPPQPAPGCCATMCAAWAAAKGAAWVETASCCASAIAARNPSSIFSCKVSAIDACVAQLARLGVDRCRQQAQPTFDGQNSP